MKMEKQIIIKGFTIRGADGNDLRISETVERDQVVISIQQNDDKARMATVRLDKEQFEAFFDIRYSIEIKNTIKHGEKEE
jgi:hypothetical protein